METLEQTDVREQQETVNEELPYGKPIAEMTDQELLDTGAGARVVQVLRQQARERFDQIHFAMAVEDRRPTPQERKERERILKVLIPSINREKRREWAGRRVGPETILAAYDHVSYMRKQQEEHAKKVAEGLEGVELGPDEENKVPDFSLGNTELSQENLEQKEELAGNGQDNTSEFEAEESLSEDANKLIPAV